MTPILLAAWLCSLPPVQDGLHRPIPRPAGFCAVAAQVATEQDDLAPTLLAALLDVIAAHESGYRTHPRGLNDHGASKGAFQTPARQTPDDALGQARLASAIVRQSYRLCPAHPLSLYASGRCGAIRVAAYYEGQARAELAQVPFGLP